MTIDVESQVRSYFRDFEQSLPTITAEELTGARVGVESLRSIAPAFGTRSRDRIAVAAAAFLVVAAAIGGVGWLIGSWSGGDAANVPPASSTTPTIAGLSDANLTWIGSEEPFPGGIISSDADGVLVSNVGLEFGSRTSFSLDGRKWVRVPRPSGESDGHMALFAGVWVTTGQLRDLPTEVVYVSNNDGGSWSGLLLPDHEQVFSQPGNAGTSEAAVYEGTVVVARINGVARDPWGFGILDGKPAEIVCNKVVTNNEVTYELAIDDYTVCLDDARSGTFVAVDLDQLTPRQREIAMRPFTPESVMLYGSVNDTELVPGTMIEGAISRIGVLGDRFAAISLDDWGRLLGVYTSVDGRSWKTIPLPQDTVSVYIDGGEIIAVTHDVEAGLTTIQTSSDGITWLNFTAFLKRPPSQLDTGASGMALIIPADPAAATEADSVIGYSRDGTEWSWQTLSDAFGGGRGEWDDATPVVGDGIVIAVARRSTVVDMSRQWFIAQLD